MKSLGVIIAGGKSSRMGGREKAFLDLAGTSLIARVQSRIHFQVSQVVINANGDAQRFAALKLPVVPDAVSELDTPLAGLHAALSYGRANGFDAVLTVPSDTPFLPLDLMKRLEEAGRGTGAAVATSMTRVHYLTGLWSSALAPVLDQFIRKEGMVRVQDFVRKVATAEVEWDVFPHDPFLNINTPEDLAEAASHIAEAN
jgi:molybdopterin-guanine dinucleotide biosynthesis protein A